MGILTKADAVDLIHDRMFFGIAMINLFRIIFKLSVLASRINLFQPWIALAQYRLAH